MSGNTPLTNARQVMDGYALLRALPENSAKLAFFDPQYRGLLDAMNYGNEGERQKKRSQLPQMSEEQIGRWVRRIAQVLKPSGHLVLWTDKWGIGEAKHRDYMRGADELQRVDLLCWNGLRPGNGKRFRCVSQYAVIIQKKPIKAAGCWTDHRMRDCWPEHSDRALHPHAKPAQLLERLIRATTKQGDMVIDPCAGGYGVLEACMLTRRTFIGCDLIGSPE